MKFIHFMMSPELLVKLIDNSQDTGAEQKSLPLLTVPDTFIMQFPSGFLSASANIPQNAHRRALWEACPQGLAVVEKHGRREFGQKMTSDELLGFINNLEAFFAEHQEEKHHLLTLLKVESREEPGRFFPLSQGASADTLFSLVPEGEYFVGVATQFQAPDLLFVTKSRNELKNLLTNVNAGGAILGAKYNNWIWRKTDKPHLFISNLMAVLALSSKLDDLKFFEPKGRALSYEAVESLEVTEGIRTTIDTSLTTDQLFDEEELKACAKEAMMKQAAALFEMELGQGYSSETKRLLKLAPSEHYRDVMRISKNRSGFIDTMASDMIKTMFRNRLQARTNSNYSEETMTAVYNEIVNSTATNDNVHSLLKLCGQETEEKEKATVTPPLVPARAQRSAEEQELAPIAAKLYAVVIRVKPDSDAFNAIYNKIPAEQRETVIKLTWAKVNESKLQKDKKVREMARLVGVAETQLSQEPTINLAKLGQ